MKTYRKETFLISICTLFLFVFVFFSIWNATQTDVPETTGSVETTTTLSITGWTTSVFTPTSINFGELEVSSSEQEKNIELEAPNYFGIEDLKWQWWYYTTLQIWELSDGDKTLEVTEAKVRIANLEVHTIAGQEGSNISVPAWVSDFILFDSENPANILERAVTTNGKIGKYWVLPHMKLTIAPYQQVWDYEGTITFTIIEDGSISPIVYASCKELLDNRASSTSWVYTINPSWSEEFEVYCDMETDWGGWTLVKRFWKKITVWSFNPWPLARDSQIWNIEDIRPDSNETVKLSDIAINSINFSEVWLQGSSDVIIQTNTIDSDRRVQIWDSRIYKEWFSDEYKETWIINDGSFSACYKYWFFIIYNWFSIIHDDCSSGDVSRDYGFGIAQDGWYIHSSSNTGFHTKAQTSYDNEFGNEWIR